MACCRGFMLFITRYFINEIIAYFELAIASSSPALVSQIPNTRLWDNGSDLSCLVNITSEYPFPEKYRAGSYCEVIM